MQGNNLDTDLWFLVVTRKLIEFQAEFQTEETLCIRTSADPTRDNQIHLSSVVYIQIQCPLTQLRRLSNL